MRKLLCAIIVLLSLICQSAQAKSSFSGGGISAARSCSPSVSHFSTSSSSRSFSSSPSKSFGVGSTKKSFSGVSTGSVGSSSGSWNSGASDAQSHQTSRENYAIYSASQTPSSPSPSYSSSSVHTSSWSDPDPPRVHHGIGAYRSSYATPVYVPVPVYSGSGYNAPVYVSTGYVQPGASMSAWHLLVAFFWIVVILGAIVVVVVWLKMQSERD